jgi:protein-S-isoprenylcysteine O-methyltransferase Ste14
LTNWKVSPTLFDMESDGTSDRAAAEAQLAALRARRSAPADRAMQPWWNDVLLGLLLFAFIGSYAFHSNWVRRPAMVVAGAVLGVVVAAISRWWTRSYVAELRGEL